MEYVYLEREDVYAYTPDGWRYIYYDSYEAMVDATGLDEEPVKSFPCMELFEIDRWETNYAY